MHRNLNKNLISVMLIACLTVTTLFVPGIFNSAAYAADEPAKASLSKSTIKTPATMVAGTRFNMTLTGDRQSAKGSVNEETRYQPYSYLIIHSNGTIKSPAGLTANSSGTFTYAIKFTDPGKKTVEVTWLYQKYKDGKWQTTSKPKTSKSIDIKGTLKFNANGGSVKTKSLYLTQNAKVGTLPKPTRLGYVFKGWYTAKSGGSKVTSTTKIKFSGGSKTLYARWASVKGAYKVSLDANGGKVSPVSIIVVKGKKYNSLQSLPTPKRTNYNFAGWYTAKTGGSRIKNTTIVKKIGRHTLYARWEENKTVISSYDAAAKTIIAKIGTQAKSQCAVYSMSFCTAIRYKKFVAPSTYLIGDLANWYTGGMDRLDFSNPPTSTSQARAMATIKKQVDNNLPCIVRCTYGTSGQHWVTVVGYRPGATTYSDLYILDPAKSDVTQVYLFYDTIYYFPKDGYIGVATY